MSERYDPRATVKTMLDQLKVQQPAIMSSNVPGLVKENGEAFSLPKLPPEGLCVLIAAIEADPSTLPRDFVDVPLTKEGLKAHVRPDGGVCLGFFGNTREDACVLYGDPTIARDDAVRYAGQFIAEVRKRSARKLTLVTS